ncbi:MAG TPA: GrpB family protein [Thermoplasmata archaeon]
MTAAAGRLAEGGRVIVVDYDPGWPATYEAEKGLLLRTIGDHVVGIEHIGSTAVPGLAAKPIIDIMVGLRRLEDAAPTIEPLRSIDYEYVPEYEAEIPERRYFRKGPPGGRTHHLHMVVHGGPLWEKHLLFRDYLRAHPETARAYARLKRDLAVMFGHDREGYTDAKITFIKSIEEAARMERAQRLSRG